MVKVCKANLVLPRRRDLDPVLEPISGSGFLFQLFIFFLALAPLSTLIRIQFPLLGSHLNPDPVSSPRNPYESGSGFLS